MYQKVTIIGRLGNDPEMRYTPQGKAVTTFSVATGRSWVDQSGQKKETTVWFRVNAWERQAETCNQYLKKGRMVMVEGELAAPKPYQTKAGEWRASLDITARQVVFLGEKEQAEAKTEDIESIPF